MESNSRPEAISAYSGCRIGFLTRHSKESVVAPVLLEALGAHVFLIDSFDTDTLGTFTREVPRVGSQLDAARRKATLAIEISGAEFGLGSEGSFVPGPFGLGTYDLEVLVLVDQRRSLEIVGFARGVGLHHHGVAKSLEELKRVAEEAAFPEHGLVLRPDGEACPPVAKGLRSFAALEAAFSEGLRLSKLQQVFLENDLRAHENPSRMRVIGGAARDLATRAATSCEKCGSPGFGPRAAVPGLPCRDCLRPTTVPLADEYSCVSCKHQEQRPRLGAHFAEPARCDGCNP